MKIADKGPIKVNVLQFMQGDQNACFVRDTGGTQGVKRTGELAQIPVSAEAHRLQRVVALAKRGNEWRAEKVKQLKEQTRQGIYHVEAADVAKGIVRSEISRLLGKGCCTLSPS